MAWAKPNFQDYQTKKLEQALISYFVSGAIRLLVSGKSLVDVTNIASPHTMLIHTELEIEEHWGVVRRVMELIREKEEKIWLQFLQIIGG